MLTLFLPQLAFAADIALLVSPGSTPDVYAPLAHRLERRGHDVRLLTLPCDATSPPAARDHLLAQLDPSPDLLVADGIGSLLAHDLPVPQVWLGPAPSEPATLAALDLWTTDAVDPLHRHAGHGTVGALLLGQPPEAHACIPPSLLGSLTSPTPEHVVHVVVAQADGLAPPEHVIPWAARHQLTWTLLGPSNGQRRLHTHHDLLQDPRTARLVHATTRSLP